MKINRSFKIRILILVTALSIGLGFVSPVSAQVIRSYILDADGKGLTDLGPNGVGMTDLRTLAGGSTYATGINDAGQVVGSSARAAGATHASITGPDRHQ